MNAPLITLVGVSKTYEFGDVAVAALRDIGFTIGRGEFVAIMGPSGSGKSTLMHLIGLLDRPNAGSYRFADVDVAALHHDAVADLRNAEIGFVFQSFNLLPRLTAEENVALPLVYARKRPGERRERARELLDVVGLTARAQHRPAQLSGGEQQRVAIARALANRPSLLLADEPTGALDSRSSGLVMKILAELNRLGITVVLITHEAEVADAAGRLITLRDGRIIGDARRAPPGVPPEMAA